MMEDYDRTMELVDAAYDSTGKSSVQFAKYQDTVEYKLKQLSGTWEQIRINFLDSDFYKNALDVINKLLDKISEFDLVDFLTLGATFLTVGRTAANNFIDSFQEVLTKSLPTVMQKVSDKIPVIGTKTQTKESWSYEHIGKKLQSSSSKTLQNMGIKFNANTDSIIKAKDQLEDIRKDLVSNGFEVNFDTDDAQENIKKLQQNIDNFKAQDSEGYMSEEITKLQTNLGAATAQLDATYKKQQQNAQIKAEAIGTAFSASLTAAITSSMVSDNPGEILVTTLVSGITAAIPTIVQAFITMDSAIAATGVGGIVIGIALVVAGLATGIKALSNYTKEQAEEQAIANSEFYAAKKEVENLTEKQEDLNEALDEANEKYDEAKTNYDNITSAQQSYKEYADQLALTTEEEEAFLDVQNEIAESYPELISYYDEEGNAILTNIGSAWDTVIEKKKEYYAIAAQEQAEAEAAANLGNYLIAQRQLESDTNFNNDYSAFFSTLLEIGDANVAGPDNTTYISENGSLYYIGKDSEGNDIERELDYDPTMEGLLKGLTNDQKAAIVTALNTSGKTLSGVDLSGTNEEIIDEIQSKLNEGNEKKEQAFLEVFQEAIEAGTEINLTGDRQEVAETVTALNTSFDSLLSSYTILSDTYSDADANIQSLMTQNILDKYDLNEQDFADSFNKSDYNKSSWYDKNGELLSDFQDEYDTALQNYLSVYLDEKGITTETIDSELSNTYTNQQQAALEAFYDDVADNNWSVVDQLDKMNELNKGGKISDQVKQDWLNANKETLSDYEDQMNYLANLVGEEFKLKTDNEGNYTGEIDDSGFDDDGLTADINELSSVAQSALYTLAKENDLTKAQIEDFIKVYNNLGTEYSTEVEEVLGNIDVSKDYTTLVNSKQTYIEQLQALGYSYSEANQIVSDYILDAAKALNNATLSKETAESNLSEIRTNRSTTLENSSKLQDAVEEQVENGFISIDTQAALEEAGFDVDSLTEVTAEGTVLIMDTVGEYIKNSLMTGVETVEGQIAINNETIKDYNTQIDEIRKAKNVLNEMPNNGESAYESYFNAESEEERDEIAKNLSKDQKEAFETLRLAGVTSYEDIDDTVTQLEEDIKGMKEANKEYEDSLSDVYIQDLQAVKEFYEDIAEEVEDLQEELEEANADMADLEDDRTEKEEDLAEKEAEYQEALHGSDDYESNLDSLINYTRQVDNLTDSITKLKEEAEDVTSEDEAKNIASDLVNNYAQKKALLEAENQAIDTGLEDTKNNLLQNYGDYVSFDEEGNLSVDFDYTDMDKNDEYKKGLEELVEKYNELNDTKQDNLDESEEIDNEMLEIQENALDEYVSVQDDLISVLKEKYQDEIDALQDKYTAMEEADSDYLDALRDAIDKQRELRDQEDKYEDLATQEKKLSLMQRDTSGVNQKEVLELEEDVEESREDLLDTEVDNIIDSLEEMYEAQKEARDAEIEYMEDVTENAQYFADWAEQIMGTWNSVEDMQAWYLANDPDSQDLTAEQTQQKLNELSDSWSSISWYKAVSDTDFSTSLVTLGDETKTYTEAVQTYYDSTKTDLQTIGTEIQTNATTAANEAIESAQKARDEAQDALNEIEQKITEKQEEIDQLELDIATAEAEQEEAYAAYISALTKATKSGYEDVVEYAVKAMAEIEGIDLTDKESADAWAKEQGYIYSDGTVTQGYYNAVKNAGGDVSGYTVRANDEYVNKADNIIGSYTSEKEANSKATSYNAAATSTYGQVTEAVEVVKVTYEVLNTNGETTGYYENVSQANAAAASLAQSGETSPEVNELPNPLYLVKKKYASGGLVDYTGIAQVDGTPSKPEAFLNAEQTEALKQLASNFTNYSSLLNTVQDFYNNYGEQVETNTQLTNNTSNVGDTSVEVHINIENISSDVDVDEALDKMENRLAEVYNYAGSSVILSK